MAQPTTRGIPLSIDVPSKLPVHCSPIQTESGTGYLLRCATANGISLSALCATAQVGSAHIPWAPSADRLAPILDISHAELRSALVLQGNYLGGPAYQTRGHTLVRWRLLRRTSPQVCIACVHHRGVCQAAWDLRPYAVCHLHGTAMVDCCAACGQSLSWFRPAVDLCRCGHYLREVDSPIHPQFELGSLEISARIASYFDPSDEGLAISDDEATCDASLPRWLEHLSLDGLCTLVLCLGGLNRPHQVMHSGSYQRFSTDSWELACSRAWLHLKFWLQMPDPSVLAPWIWEAGLRSMRERSVCLADQQVADLLLKTVFGESADLKDGRCRAVRAQMSLFGD